MSFDIGNSNINNTPASSNAGDAIKFTKQQFADKVKSLFGNANLTQAQINSFNESANSIFTTYDKDPQDDKWNVREFNDNGGQTAFNNLATEISNAITNSINTSLQSSDIGNNIQPSGPVDQSDIDAFGENLIGKKTDAEGNTILTVKNANGETGEIKINAAGQLIEADDVGFEAFQDAQDTAITNNINDNFMKIATEYGIQSVDAGKTKIDPETGIMTVTGVDSKGQEIELEINLETGTVQKNNKQE